MKKLAAIEPVGCGRRAMAGCKGEGSVGMGIVWIHAL